MRAGNKKVCVVCKSRGEESGISSYRFPNDSVRRQEWLRRLVLDEVVQDKLNDSSRVCEKHFDKHQYVNQYQLTLRKDALPNILEPLTATTNKLAPAPTIVFPPQIQVMDHPLELPRISEVEPPTLCQPSTPAGAAPKPTQAVRKLVPRIIRPRSLLLSATTMTFDMMQSTAIPTYAHPLAPAPHPLAPAPHPIALAPHPLAPASHPIAPAPHPIAPAPTQSVSKQVFVMRNRRSFPNPILVDKLPRIILPRPAIGSTLTSNTVKYPKDVDYIAAQLSCISSPSSITNGVDETDIVRPIKRKLNNENCNIPKQRWRLFDMETPTIT